MNSLTQALLEKSEKLLSGEDGFDFQEWDSTIERISSHLNQSLQIEENKDSEELKKLLFNCAKLNDLLSAITRESSQLRYLDDVIHYSSLSIKMNYEVGESYYQRGHAYFVKGMVLKDPESIEFGIDDFTKAINVNNNNGFYYGVRGLALYQKGVLLKDSDSFTSGIADYTKAIELGFELGMSYFNRAGLYYENGLLLKDIRCFDASIDDYTTAIKMNGDRIAVYRNRGLVHREKANLLKNSDCFDLSIDDFTKAININTEIIDIYCNTGVLIREDVRYLNEPNIDPGIDDFTKTIKWHSQLGNLYYERGISHYDKGKLLKDAESLDYAIEDYSKAIEWNEEYANVYYSRGLAYDYLNQSNDCLSDYHIYQYLRHDIAKEEQTCTINVIQAIKEEAYNHYSFLLDSLSENNITNRLCFDYLEVSEKLKDFLLFFKYAGFDSYKLTITNVRFQRALPILIFHLKGCVVSYKLYDEILDDGKIELSAQDYYYYVQSARQFSRDAKKLIGANAILKNAIETIENREHLACTEKYYLGLLYFITSVDEEDDKQKIKWKEKALDMFIQSKCLLWSRRMIDILKKEDSSQADFDKYLLSHCNEKKEICIEALINPYDSQDDFLKQFADYFHFREVEDAYYKEINVFDTNENEKVKSNKVVFHDFLWEVYFLSDYSTQELGKRILKLNGDMVFREVVEKMEIEPLTEDKIAKFENNFPKYEVLTNGKDAERQIFNDMANKVLTSSDIEIALTYLYFKNIIDKSQYLSIKLYHERFLEDLESIKEGRLLAQVFFSMIPLFNKYLVLLSAPLLKLFDIYSIGKKEEAIKRDYSLYETYSEFSHDLWKIMNNKYGDDI